MKTKTITQAQHHIVKLLAQAGRRLARPDVFFYCGLWMILLLVAGTISQKYIGLYQARLKFFSSFVFELYGVPLLGGRMAMGLILISLVLKTLYSFSSLKNLPKGHDSSATGKSKQLSPLNSKSEKRFKCYRYQKKLADFFLHLGVILLLSGAFITGIFSQEGYMALKEQEHSSIVSDYHKVELSIESHNKTLKAFHEQIFTKNQVLTGPFPFSIRIQEFMKNARPAPDFQQVGAKNTGPTRNARPAPDFQQVGAKNTGPTRNARPAPDFQQVGAKNTGPTRNARPAPDFQAGLVKKKLEKINEENQAGLLFQIITAQQYKNYALFEPVPQIFTLQNQKYTIRLRPQRTYLPFSLKLIQFKKEHYPGSDKAKSYQSWVHILDKGTKQRRLIRMNRPLRYKGYTFYQSSYIEGKKQDISVLSVVKNAGRAFPYISSLIICFSLLIYIFSTFLPSSSTPPMRKNK